MLEVVNSRAAAATLIASQRHESEPRNAAQQFNRRLRDSLSVYQVARRIVSDSALDMFSGLADALFDQELRNVPDLRAKLARAIGKRRIIGKQRGVLLHRRSA